MKCVPLSLMVHKDERFSRRHFLRILRLTAISPLAWSCWAIAYAILMFLGLRDVLDLRLPDNDDYMRLQQVRDFLAGQAWADTDQHRFQSPEGGLMHFSRLPDVIMAALFLTAQPFVGSANAEIFMLTAYPAVLFLGFLATATLAMREIDPQAAFPHIAITAMLGPVLFQFFPGRVDHHGFQLLLLMLLVLATLRAQTSHRWAAGAGAIIIAMLAIGMETAPFAAVCGGWRWPSLVARRKAATAFYIRDCFGCVCGDDALYS